MFSEQLSWAQRVERLHRRQSPVHADVALVPSTPHPGWMWPSFHRVQGFVWLMWQSSLYLISPVMRNSFLSRSYKMLAQIKLVKHGIEKQKTNATATIIETNHKTKLHAHI